MRKHKFKTIGSNAIDPASTTNKDWGYIPVPNKGGVTTNSAITEKMFQKELELMKGGVLDA